MKPTVLVARELFPSALALLEQHAKLDVWRRDTPMTREELMARLAGVRGLICQLTQQVDAEVLRAGSDLQIVANAAVGVDNIDVAEATARGIAVTNTPGVLDDTTADFVWALMLGLSRRVAEADKMVRSGEWKGWDLMQLLGREVTGGTLGIIGLGRIGRKVAERARGFRMRTLYNNRSRLPQEEEETLGVQWAEKDALLAESDFVVIQAPLTEETRHLMGTDEFRRMKGSAFLVNASRGPVVDEAALVGALAAGEIAGAALDVFEDEPRVHPGLLGLPNVLLAPHIASASVETRTRMAVMAAENVVAVLEGVRPPHLVNDVEVKAAIRN